MLINPECLILDFDDSITLDFNVLASHFHNFC